MKATLTPTTQLRNILLECWQYDSDLLSRYHVAAPADLDTCVNRTLSDLNNSGDRHELYVIRDLKESPAGFFLKAGSSYLREFWIAPRCRGPQDSAALWSELQSCFNGDFIAFALARDTRAIAFFRTVGEETRYDGNLVIFKLRGKGN